jgi:pilus assembly protein Flp/PilA
VKGIAAMKSNPVNGKEVKRMLEFIKYGIPAYFHSLREEEEGQALVEYALILALVSVVALVILGTLGTNVVARLTDVANALT